MPVLVSRWWHRHRFLGINRGCWSSDLNCTSTAVLTATSVRLVRWWRKGSYQVCRLPVGSSLHYEWVNYNLPSTKPRLQLVSGHCFEAVVVEKSRRTVDQGRSFVAGWQRRPISSHRPQGQFSSLLLLVFVLFFLRYIFVHCNHCDARLLLRHRSRAGAKDRRGSGECRKELLLAAITYGIITVLAILRVRHLQLRANDLAMMLRSGRATSQEKPWAACSTSATSGARARTASHQEGKPYPRLQ